MTKEEILNYVMDTPENTNRMVLSDMLDEFNTGGGSDGICLIVISPDPDTGNPVADKTFTEAIEALEQNKIVQIKVAMQEGMGTYYFAKKYNSETSITFTGIPLTSSNSIVE